MAAMCRHAVPSEGAGQGAAGGGLPRAHALEASGRAPSRAAPAEMQRVSGSVCLAPIFAA